MGYQLTDNGHWKLWECPKEEDHVDTAPELGGVQSYSVVRHSTAEKKQFGIKPCLCTGFLRMPDSTIVDPG